MTREIPRLPFPDDDPPESPLDGPLVPEGEKAGQGAAAEVKTMRAAVYARKSTDQKGDAKSTDRQVKGGRAFIEGRDGWTFAGAYIDEGLSGYLFAGRPEFQRLLRDATGGALDAVVLYDLDRFGRNSRRTMEALHALADAGVTVWDYRAEREIEVDSFAGEIEVVIRARIAQEERERARKRTYDALLERAKRGWVTGGAVYGYDNVKFGDHVERVVNERQAKVVRDIYGRFAAGASVREITRYLNGRKVKSPRGDRWAPNTVRNILQRPLYRGVDYYGRTKTLYGRELGKRRITVDRREREVGEIEQPRETWVEIPLPGLRIIDEATAARVDARFEDRKGRDVGGRPTKAHGGYLLTGGMLKCPTCGGNFESEAGRFYVCAKRRRAAACSNTLRLPIAKTDDDILSTVEGDQLSPKAIERLLAAIDTSGGDEAEHLASELERRRGEVKRLTDSIAAGIDPTTVAPAIRERETEIARLEARLRAPRPSAPDVKKLRKALTLTAKGWKKTLRSEPRLARMLLRRLVGPITVYDESKIGPVRWQAESKAAGAFDLQLDQSPRGARIS